MNERTQLQVLDLRRSESVVTLEECLFKILGCDEGELDGRGIAGAWLLVCQGNRRLPLGVGFGIAVALEKLWRHTRGTVAVNDSGSGRGR